MVKNKPQILQKISNQLDNISENNSGSLPTEILQNKNLTEEYYPCEEDYFIPPEDIPLPDLNEIQENDRASAPKVVATISAEQMKNPYKIWGLVVIRLREQNLITLHTACGELKHIKFDGDNLVVEVSEEYLFNILTNPNNFSKISLELSKINDKIHLNFVLKKKESRVLDSYTKLKELFGDDLETNFNTFGAN